MPLYKTEYEFGADFVKAMKSAGFRECRKIDDRSGGFPDYLCVGEYDDLAFGVELKIVGHPPPWTPKQSRMRPQQIRHFRTWEGVSYFLAYETSKIASRFWLCRAPNLIRWYSPNDLSYATSCLSHIHRGGPKNNQLMIPEKSSPWLTA